MSIDEAIAHAREVAERHRKSAKHAEDRFLTKRMQDMHRKNSIKEAEEHEQLAEWLEELKEYKKDCVNRETFEKMKSKSYKKGHKQGYNKAIDDFMEKIDDDICNDCSKCGNGCRLFELRKIAEQLKEGGVDAGNTGMCNMP